jgi:tetratricopeptide (TPR) repeat protein
MSEAKEDMRAGRFATAARKLKARLAFKPGRDEAYYLLGACEKAKGHVDDAEKAWLRVSRASEFASRAMLGRLELRVERGQLAETERLIESALKDPGFDGSDAPILLGPVYCQEGRVEESKRLIDARWNHFKLAGEGTSEKAVNLLRLYIELERKLIPVELIRSALDRAGQLAPDDATLAVKGRASS